MNRGRFTVFLFSFRSKAENEPKTLGRRGVLVASDAYARGTFREARTTRQ